MYEPERRYERHCQVKRNKFDLITCVDNRRLNSSSNRSLKGPKLIDKKNP